MSVVVAFSPDVYGRAALEHGAAEATSRGVPLVVVNATTGASLVDARYAHDDEIAALERRLAGEGVEVEVRRDLVDDVADAVLAAAEERGATLIVVGVRPRSPVGKALMGSVAQRVILDARCPVLAVKPAES